MSEPPTRRRRTAQERLADAQAAADRAAARLAKKRVQVEKYQAVQKGRERKDETRRKILAGALALKEKDGVFRGKLMALIDEYVIPDRDRALFGLAPLALPVPVRPAVVMDMPIAAAPVPPAPVMSVTAPAVVPPPPTKPVAGSPSASAPKESNLTAAVKAVGGILLSLGASAITPDPSRTRKEG